MSGTKSRSDDDDQSGESLSLSLVTIEKMAAEIGKTQSTYPVLAIMVKRSAGDVESLIGLLPLDDEFSAAGTEVVASDATLAYYESSNVRLNNEDISVESSIFEDAVARATEKLTRLRTLNNRARLLIDDHPRVTAEAAKASSKAREVIASFDRL